MCDDPQEHENHEREIREQMSEMDDHELLCASIMSACALLDLQAQSGLITPPMAQFSTLLTMLAERTGEPQVIVHAQFTQIQVNEVWLKVKADFDKWLAEQGDLGEGA